VRDAEDDQFVLLEKAEGGCPEAMFEVAQLYDAGAFGRGREDQYLFWLKAFLNSEEVQDILGDLEDEEENNGIFVSDDYPYYPLIIEVGISLGLYYKKSSHIEELELAYEAFKAALLASKFDFLEVDDESDSTSNVMSLMQEVSKRIERIKKVNTDE